MPGRVSPPPGHHAPAGAGYSRLPQSSFSRSRKRCQPFSIELSFMGVSLGACSGTAISINHARLQLWDRYAGVQTGCHMPRWAQRWPCAQSGRLMRGSTSSATRAPRSSGFNVWTDKLKRSPLGESAEQARLKFTTCREIGASSAALI